MTYLTDNNMLTYFKISLYIQLLMPNASQTDQTACLSKLIMQNKPNLLNAKMNINKVLTKDYENKRLCGCDKNKPNQTQSVVSLSEQLWQKKPWQPKKSTYKREVHPNFCPSKLFLAWGCAYSYTSYFVMRISYLRLPRRPAASSQ